MLLNDNDLDYNLVVIKIDERNIIYAKYGNKETLLSSIGSSETSALGLFYFWRIRFKEVTFLFIDDFDAYYHFET